MFWLKGMTLVIQMAGIIGLWGMSSSAEELADNFYLEERYDTDLVSDFLSMDAEAFEKQYDKNALYERNVLYCTEEAWRLHGVAQPACDGVASYYLDDIRAIRFTNVWPQDTVIYEDTILFNQFNLSRYFGDYAVSMYFQESRDEESGEEEIRLIEFSFVRVEVSEQDRGDVTIEDIYKSLEYDYYDGWREMDQVQWKKSPEGTKAVYIVNGMIPNAPSQIVMRYQENVPNLILREQWEYCFAGWIDEDHFVCYNDAGLYLVHIETRLIEEIVTISTQEGNFETWGCQYEIRGDR
ncbi:MAG: hypothetical protein K1W20_10810 [Lachnospiraceae bacterium]